MKVKEPELGGIALSLTGRDKGRCFIIEEIIDDNYVYITDGMPLGGTGWYFPLFLN